MRWTYLVLLGAIASHGCGARSAYEFNATCAADAPSESCPDANGGDESAATHSPGGNGGTAGNAGTGGFSGWAGQAGAAGVAGSGGTGGSSPQEVKCDVATGEPYLIADNQPGARALTTGAGAVFWYQNGDDAAGGFMRWANDGADPELLAPSEPSLAAVADGSALYSLGQSVAGKVLSVPFDGGAPTELARGVRTGRHMAQDEDALYWLESSQPQSLTTGDGRVRTVAKSGGMVEVLSADRREAGGGIALTDQYVYWSEGRFLGGGGRLLRVPKRGGATEVVLESRRVASVVSDGEEIYFVGNVGDSGYADGIWRFSETGSPTLLFDGGTPLNRMIVDGPCIYFVDDRKSIRKMNKDGGSASFVASTGTSTYLAADAGHIYFSQTKRSEVWAIPKL